MLYEKKIISVAVSIAMFASMLPFAAYAAGPTVDYDEINYDDNVITVGTNFTGEFSSNTDYVDDYYEGLAIGHQITLEDGKSYAIKLTLNSSKAAWLNAGLILFDGDDFSNVISENMWGNQAPSLKQSVVIYYTSQSTKEHNLLAISDSSVESLSYTISTKEVDSIGEFEEEWSIKVFNDYSSPAVGPDGTIYVSAYYSEETLVPGTCDQYDDKYYLNAVNPDGTMKWQYELKTDSDATPVVGENAVYTAAYSYYDDVADVNIASVYAVDFEGNTKWIVDLEAYYDDDNNYIDYDCWKPLLLDEETNTLIIEADDVILALDGESGEIVWEKLNINNALNSPVISGSNLVFTAWDFTDDQGFYYENPLVYLDIMTGEVTNIIDWLDDCCGANDSNLFADEEGTVYCVADGFTTIWGIGAIKCPVYAINADGSLKWVKSFGFYDYDEFLITEANGKVYATDGVTLVVADSQTGEIISEIDLMWYIGRDGWDFSDITADKDGKIYFYFYDTVYQLTPNEDYTDFEILAAEIGYNSNHMKMVIANGYLYVCDSEHYVDSDDYANLHAFYLYDVPNPDPDPDPDPDPEISGGKKFFNDQIRFGYMGDVTGDNVFDIADIVAMRAFGVGNRSFNLSQYMLADLVSDGQFDIADIVRGRYNIVNSEDPVLGAQRFGINESGDIVTGNGQFTYQTGGLDFEDLNNFELNKEDVKTDSDGKITLSGANLDDEDPIEIFIIETSKV